MATDKKIKEIKLREFYDSVPFSIFSNVGWSATFANVAVAGEALNTLVREILGAEMAAAVGKIIDVKAQDFQKFTGEGGHRDACTLKRIC
ncbi:MAG: hypothetical protein LBR77_10970 [Lachnospiraceae bacterium]|jgi:hypothetical protein|nr:hypothetical protein [Lachnospiraceae bacterium]